MEASKYSEQLFSLRELKEKMKPLYICQSDKQQHLEDIPAHWNTIYCKMESSLEQLKNHNLKAQHLQNSDSWSEKDIVTLIRILELIYTCLKDCLYINLHTKQHNATNERACARVDHPPFGEQMGKLKQQIDLFSIELTKVRTIKDALDNIYSIYNMELAGSSSDQDNEEEDCDDDQNDVFI
uniref:Uncharacterized protein n=1 Tax=Anopheles dirus TaxID=7168 RepID=A0A182NWT8_9DIPT